MQRHYARWLLPATFALTTATATAQITPGPVQPRPAADPLDASVEVPSVVYRSALATYRQLGDTVPVPWREANDRVGRIGGWRAYAREANSPEPTAGTEPGPRPAAGAAPMPSSKPTPDARGTDATR